jgi:serine phosphatase RsbU (regulator of sigma subunit)
LERLLEEVGRFRGEAEQNDDLTALVVRFSRWSPS